jgi:2-hydroxychromene-2-carboxylate isomerase
MPGTLDFFFEFASTYSYPAAMRIDEPFLLGPIFKQQGFDTSPFNIYPAKGRYMWRDLARTCEDLGLPFRRPEPFPQNGLLAARVAHVGLAEDWGKPFCRAVFVAEFAQGRQIGNDDVIRDVLSKLGLEPAPVLARARSSGVKNGLRAMTEEAVRHGIFGAPSFVVGEELFWGNDRLAQAISYAAQGRAAKEE